MRCLLVISCHSCFYIDSNNEDKEFNEKNNKFKNKKLFLHKRKMIFFIHKIVLSRFLVKCVNFEKFDGCLCVDFIGIGGKIKTTKSTANNFLGRLHFSVLSFL